MNKAENGVRHGANGTRYAAGGKQDVINPRRKEKGAEENLSVQIEMIQMPLCFPIGGILLYGF